MPRLRRGQPHSRVEDVDNQDIIAGGVPTRLWLMKVPAQLSQRNTAVSAASVIKLDTTNKRALRGTVPWNEWSLTYKRQTNCHPWFLFLMYNYSD